ncbi:MAG: hypothetical protein IIZ67_04855 [Bacilli bacterium]|nr:hypothetical protein [Bacilli bacterium]
MRDLYIKRNELCKKSMIMSVVKWDLVLSDNRLDELIKEQDKVYKRFKFYDNYLKEREKLKNDKVLSIKKK